MTTVELDAAIQQIKAGKPAGARQILADLLRNDPDNEAAWMWLSSVVEEDEQVADCLERVLALNPGNEAARLQLAHLRPEGLYKASATSLHRASLRPQTAPSLMDDVLETRLVTLACPSCGAGLNITPDKDLFVCPACGNSHVVRRSAGLIALEPVLEQMREMQHEVDRTSRELNIHHLIEDIAGLEKAKTPYKKGLADGTKITTVAVIILIFLNIGFSYSPLILLGLVMLAGGLGWASYNFIKQRQLETRIQLKQLEIIRERNL